MSESKKEEFQADLVRGYPSAEKKLDLDVRLYSLFDDTAPGQENLATTTYISPHGVEFQSNLDLAEGSLIKVNIDIPDYWSMKTRFIQYTRVDQPSKMRVIAKVISSEEIVKKSRKKEKKRTFLAQILNIDEIDEKVLKLYLSDEK